jgi:hypothetical protein
MQNQVLFPLHEERRMTVALYKSKKSLSDRQQLSEVENVK